MFDHDPIFYIDKLISQQVRKLATELGLKVHMDGARIFNAATALGVPVAHITQHVDSISFCLSKVMISVNARVHCAICQALPKVSRFSASSKL